MERRKRRIRRRIRGQKPRKKINVRKTKRVKKKS